MFEESGWLKNMTKRTKPKKDEHGKYIKNGVVPPSPGLNKAILDSMVGQYRLIHKVQGSQRRRSQLIKIPPPGHFVARLFLMRHTDPGQSAISGSVHSFTSVALPVMPCAMLLSLSKNVGSKHCWKRVQFR